MVRIHLLRLQSSLYVQESRFHSLGKKKITVYSKHADTNKYQHNTVQAVFRAYQLFKYYIQILNGKKINSQGLIKKDMWKKEN